MGVQTLRQGSPDWLVLGEAAWWGLPPIVGSSCGGADQLLKLSRQQARAYTGSVFCNQGAYASAGGLGGKAAEF